MIGPNSKYSEDYLKSILTGDRKSSIKVINECLLSEPNLLNVYEDVVKNALYRVGELWELNKISVADEHMSTAVTESVLNELYPKILTANYVAKSVVVASIENEYHKIGARMVADTFDFMGWNTHFIGANVPLNDLIRFLEDKKPDLVALSVSIYFHMPVIKKTVKEINKRIPGLRIILGGQAFTKGGNELFKHNNSVTYIPDLKSLQDFIKKMTV